MMKRVPGQERCAHKFFYNYEYNFQELFSSIKIIRKPMHHPSVFYLK